jgi:hypothetical protein
MKNDGGKVKNQACESMKSFDKRRSAVLWKKQSERVDGKALKDSGTLRKHRATHWNKWQQERSENVVGMIMWVNKR